MPYVGIPFFGKDHILARIAEPGGRVPRIPLFTLKKADAVSGSSMFKPDETAAIVDAGNPDLPRLPQNVRFVVAGQQPGLLTGPLYVFLKAVTLIALAERLEKKTGCPTAPLFWVASEDHDILEVNRVVVNGQRFVQPFAGELRRGKMPQVGEVSLEEGRQPLLDFLKAALPETAFTSEIMEHIASADFSSYAALFQSLMYSLFGHKRLRLIDPRALRPLTAPVLAALVDDWPAVQQAFDQGGALVEASGFDPPLARPGVFEIVNGCRTALEFKDDRVELSDGVFSFSEAARIIRSRPHAFSPGAALRPILQDAVLPVIATVAGPTELLYLWQIRSIYPVVEVEPSQLLPRISASFVEAKIFKAAKKAGLDRNRLFEGFERKERAQNELPPDPWIERIEKKMMALLEELDRYSGQDSAKWLKKRRESLAAQAAKIVHRLREERQADTGLDTQRREKIVAALAPGGKAQERVVGIFEFLNRYGPDFIDRCFDELDPLAKEHQVIFISTAQDNEQEET